MTGTQCPNQQFIFNEPRNFHAEEKEKEKEKKKSLVIYLQFELLTVKFYRHIIHDKTFSNYTKFNIEHI